MNGAILYLQGLVPMAVLETKQLSSQIFGIIINVFVYIILIIKNNFHLSPLAIAGLVVFVSVDSLRYGRYYLHHPTPFHPTINIKTFCCLYFITAHSDIVEIHNFLQKIYDIFECSDSSVFTETQTTKRQTNHRTFSVPSQT